MTGTAKATVLKFLMDLGVFCYAKNKNLLDSIEACAMKRDIKSSSGYGLKKGSIWAALGRRSGRDGDQYHGKRSSSTALLNPRWLFGS